LAERYGIAEEPEADGVVGEPAEVEPVAEPETLPAAESAGLRHRPRTN
jgi:hypothetical protein